MLRLRINEGRKGTPYRFIFIVPDPRTTKGPNEVLIETFIRKQLRLKAHTVTKVEETAEHMLVFIDRLGQRLLRCGVRRQRCRGGPEGRKQRVWKDLSLRKLPFPASIMPAQPLPFTTATPASGSPVTPAL